MNTEFLRFLYHRFIPLSVLVFILSGCLEIETTTEIRTDGTIRRVITFEGDSASVYSERRVIQLDTLWGFSYDKPEEKKHRLTATRTFSTLEEINEAIKGKSGEFLSFIIEGKSDWYWFYTDYTYKETFKRFGVFRNIPITDYLSQKELDLFLLHAIQKLPFTDQRDSLLLADAEQKYDEWETRNVFESVFAELEKGADLSGSKTVTPAKLREMKESLYTDSRPYLKKNTFDTLRYIIPKRLGVRNLQPIMDANPEGFARLKRMHDFELAVTQNTYSAAVVLPGTIIRSNARSAEGPRAEWKDYAGYAYFDDFVMTATSRDLNWWAIIWTALALLLGVVVLIRRSRNI